MKSEIRTVIIYLPNGTEQKFTTSKSVTDGSSDYQLVDIIECEPNEVRIAFKDENRIESEAFVRMPFILNITK